MNIREIINPFSISIEALSVDKPSVSFQEENSIDEIIKLQEKNALFNISIEKSSMDKTTVSFEEENSINETIRLQRNKILFYRESTNSDQISNKRKPIEIRNTQESKKIKMEPRDKLQNFPVPTLNRDIEGNRSLENQLSYWRRFEILLQAAEFKSLSKEEIDFQEYEIVNRIYWTPEDLQAFISCYEQLPISVQNTLEKRNNIKYLFENLKPGMESYFDKKRKIVNLTYSKVYNKIKTIPFFREKFTFHNYTQPPIT